MYKIGDYIVKSTEGVCRVDNIQHLNMSGVDKNKLYYLLLPIGQKNQKIYIPVDKADENMRRAMTEEEAWQFIDKIPEIEGVWIENEKTREQWYKDAVRSCKPEALIGIIKMAYMRKKKRLTQGKKNMMVDERYFQMAESNLYSELGFALNKNKDEICQVITDSISRKQTEE